MRDRAPVPELQGVSPLDLERLDLSEQLLRSWNDMMSFLGALPSQSLCLVEKEMSILKDYRNIDPQRIEALIACFQYKAEELRRQIN